MKIVIIKIGGSLLEDKEKRLNLWMEITSLKAEGFSPCIVHGGGKEISKWIKAFRREASFKDGLRYTSKEDLDIVNMVLSGKINKEITGELLAIYPSTMGISAMDLNLVTATRLEEFGEVGRVKDVNLFLLKNLLSLDIILVISPISSAKGGFVNVNADEVASILAAKTKSEYLFLLSDTNGVYGNPTEPQSLIKKLNKDDISLLIESKKARDGMIPKLRSASYAMQNGAKAVFILDGRKKNVISKALKLGDYYGTRIY